MALDFGLTVAGSVGILILTLASAFFSSSELAIFSLARHRIDALAAAGSRGGLALGELRADPHRLLVTVLVGNNVANIAAASLATALLGQILPAGQAVTGATVFTSCFVLVLGEIAPKSYAVQNAEPWALRVSRPLSAVQRVMSPVVFLFEIATDAVNRLTGGSSAFETYLTREEIETIVLSGAETGAIESGEGEMIRGVLDLGETTVKAVMVPRVDMIAAPDSSSLSDVIGLCADEHVTRVPIYGENRDDIRGVVDLRDAIRARDSDGSLSDVLREPRVVPDSKPIDELLGEMQRDGLRMAIVVDEFGSTDGLVTLEDVIEEVVGEILDHGEDEPVLVVDERTALVRGWATVPDVNEALGLELPTDADFETIAGLLQAQTGGVPEEGDRVEIGTALVTVLEATNTRIRRVRIERLEPDDL
jgi:CBS domain containing-hemolysin-like protein